MNDQEIVCYCSNVTRGQIIDAIHKGAKNLDDIRKMTSACTIGSCKELSPRGKCCSPDIMEILNEFISEG